MSDSLSFKKISAIILLCTAVLSTGIFLYVNQIERTLERNRTMYLEEVARQTTSEVEMQVFNDLALLRSIATAIESLSKPTASHIDRLMKNESAVNNFKRMGFVRPDGMAMLSDDLLLDLSKEEHIKKALAGEANVSERITDAADGKDILVEAVPARKNGKIIGVLFATRSVEEFAKELDTQSFRGEGYSAIVRANGDSVARALHKNAISQVENIFNLPDDPQGQLTRSLKEPMQNRQSGTVKYTSAEKGELHISYQPLNINDWYLLSVVPTVQMTRQINALVWRLLGLCLAVVAAGLCAWGYIYIQQKKSREKLFTTAFIDPITQHKNLAAIRPEMEQIFRTHTNQSYAIVAMDVGKFQSFNERYGFKTGDTLLKHLSRVIQEGLKQDELFTRIYADRFAMLLKYSSEGELKNRLELLAEQISNFQTEDKKTFALMLAFGVYPIEDRSESAQEMYNRACVAKKRVKGRYDEIVAFYQKRWHQELTEEALIESRMRQGIEKKEFRFFVEPIRSLKDDSLFAAEAVADWPVPERQDPLEQTVFRPVFERNGFIYQYGRYLLDAALETLSTWKAQGKKLIPLVVKIADEHLTAPGFAERLAAKAKEMDVEPKWLYLELTETKRHILNARLKAAGEELKQQGFNLTVRYTGLVSPAFKEMPIDGVKIGRQMWTKSPDRKSNMLAQSLGQVCQELGIFLAADDVASQADADRIKALGFSYAQGPFVGPKVKPGELL
ncbi:EAL domain-containing protein [Candidatus Avelusimicrobium stercoris]|uniref:EAL domain-containing protein n=1 Tax=Candidatus Avelusimicrobium stercoris TaxID=1947924 RepID=UPI003D128D09